MSRREPDSRFCSICFAEDLLCRPAVVKWPGLPICREHLAESHMRAEGIEAYPVDVMLDAPSMLQ